MIIGQVGSDRCCCGPCRGFQAFDGSHRFFKRATFYDVDCCVFGPCSDSNGQDGRVVFESTGCGYGIVVESTGNYGHSQSGSTCIDCKSIYPLGSIHNMIPLMQNGYLRCGNHFESTPGVVNATKATAHYDQYCCNADGSKIYWELTDEITDESDTQCDGIGACCGKTAYGSPTGNIDDATTCRMVHECECDTDAGDVWHGAGTSCNPNPCCCEGFRAFDGSARYFQYARLIDTDTCFATPPDDGYIVFQWQGSTSQANTAVCSQYGKVVECGPPGSYWATAYPVGRCNVLIEDSHGNNASSNTATYRAYEVNPDCGNADGSHWGLQLYGEISCTANPLP